ncbi:MAG TPA: choice-of-anchor B family protein [Acidimicrobiales bacterium]|nr:choice-of-anchor B family protein [Acidimicrobiales bacterium]
MGTHRHGRSRVAAALTAAAVLTTLLGVVPRAGAHPGEQHQRQASGGIVVRVESPSDLAGSLPALQWADSGEVADQAGELVYAGSGCTLVSYAPVAPDVAGKVVLVDDRASAANPVDQCPSYTFAQKVLAAEAAGAIGFVQIPAEGDEPTGNATAGAASIPALEVFRTDQVLAVRDAVIGGTAVSVTLADESPVLERLSDVPCVDGMAGPFPCDGVDLLSFVPAEEFDGQGQSDLWGWTDPETGDEYVMMGKTDGTAFFRVTDPTNPVYLGALPNPAALQEIWHDIKVYEDHAFIVSESMPHGMLVFDLTRLRDVTEPREWDADATYSGTPSAHNIAINEDTGYAYIVGGNAAIVAPDVCLSGLHMVDINDPQNPTFAGCYLLEGGPGTAARTVGSPVQEASPAAYVHDAQCVIYDGPDTRYTGRELCFNFAEDAMDIADVTDKLNPTTVGTTDYDGVAYTHQGWLTEDHRYVLANDELDEVGGAPTTRTIVLDVTDLENPQVHFIHEHETPSIDHNNYVHEGLVYQSNYTSGLRILDVSNVAGGTLEPEAFFDVFPANDDPTFDGTWSNYPYFESGTIAVSGIGEGLFLVRRSGSGDDGPTTRPARPFDDDCTPGIRGRGGCKPGGGPTY